MHWLDRVLAVIGLMVVLIAIAGIGMNVLLDRRILEEVRSPSGDLSAVLHSLSEGDSVA
jgi:hypothetical protein